MARARRESAIMVTEYSNANQSVVSGPSDLPSRIVLRILWIAIALKTARIQMDRQSVPNSVSPQVREGGPENMSAPEVGSGGDPEIRRTTRAKTWIFCPTGQTREELVSSSSRLGVAEGEELYSHILSQKVFASPLSPSPLERGLPRWMLN